MPMMMRRGPITDPAMMRRMGVKRDLMFAAGALLVMGLVLVLFPDTGAELFCRVAGAFLCLWGIMRALTYFFGTHEVLTSYALVQGVALLAYGIYFLLKPERVAESFHAALSILLLIDAVLDVQLAVDFGKLKLRGWWFELAGAVIVGGLGVVAFINPFPTDRVWMIFTGSCLMAGGIWDFVSILVLDSYARKLMLEREGIAADLSEKEENA